MTEEGNVNKNVAIHSFSCSFWVGQFYYLFIESSCLVDMKIFSSLSTHISFFSFMHLWFSSLTYLKLFKGKVNLTPFHKAKSTKDTDSELTPR